MRKGLVISAASVLVLAGAATSLLAASAPQQYQSALCRRPAGLAALPPEARPVVPQQGGRDPGVRGSRDDVYASAPPPPPPPPPIASPATEAAEEESIVVTGSGASSRSAPIVSPYPSAPPLTYRSHQRPQSGLLTAGDHDDLLNPALYARYVNGFCRPSDCKIFRA